jgi:hypothetical protein
VADPVERALAGIAGFIAVLISLYGSLWVLLSAAIAAQRPDPAASDGDPCCPHPDTWGQVADWGSIALTMASVDALIFTGGVACALYARDGCWPRCRRLRRLPAAAVVLTAGFMAVSLALRSGSG